MPQLLYGGILGDVLPVSSACTRERSTSTLASSRSLSCETPTTTTSQSSPSSTPSKNPLTLPVPQPHRPPGLPPETYTSKKKKKQGNSFRTARDLISNRFQPIWNGNLSPIHVSHAECFVLIVYKIFVINITYLQ